MEHLISIGAVVAYIFGLYAFREFLIRKDYNDLADDK